MVKLIMSQVVQGRISENSLTFCGEKDYHWKPSLLLYSYSWCSTGLILKPTTNNVEIDLKALLLIQVHDELNNF